MYLYYEIYGVNPKEDVADAAPLLAFLATLPELVVTPAGEVQNAPGQPWVSVGLCCGWLDSYRSISASESQVNLVLVVGAERYGTAGYESIVRGISGHLGWRWRLVEG